MQDFIIRLLICSVTMSALGLLYIAVTPLLAKRYSVMSRYYVWLILVAGLIIPFRPQFESALVKVELPGNANVTVLRAGNGAPGTAQVSEAFPSSFTNVPWRQIAAAVWPAGMVVFLFYHLMKHFRFLKLTARWSENITDEQTLKLLDNLKIEMGVSQKIGLQVCDSIGSPMMTGFAKPRIVLPKADFGKEELYFILKHELVHFKRKDLWYKCLVLIAAAIHWFNPIVHLMAKAIGLQCELSCDAEVVRGTGIKKRQLYSETIIGVVRRRSKVKTALSTYFYGGKKGMKKRICSIMDMRSKKAGAAVLCCALLLTLGTGAAFAANAVNAEAAGTNDTIPYAYSFKPDPEIYSQYSSYGITISDDGENLFCSGQKVRLFVDEHSDTEAFFLDETGTLDVHVIRNTAGDITGIESIPEQKAKEYRSAFFAGHTKPNEEVKETTKETVQETVQDVEGQNKLDLYSAYGISLSADGEIMYWNGRRVKFFVDQLSDGSFETYWGDDAGTVSLAAVRNRAGEITSIKNITEEQANKYKSLLEE